MTMSHHICPSCGAKLPGDVLVCPHDGTLLTREASHAPCQGKEVPGGFHLLSLLGQGAMAEVYRGADSEGHEVAVKVLRESAAAQPGVSERFLREGKLASTFEHPALLRVQHTGAVECDGKQRPLLVTELLQGRTLKQLLDDQPEGRLTPERCLRLMVQVCEGVGWAHERGIVHRDLKPENLMILENPGGPDRVKVLDFGLARAERLESSFATKTGQVLGTAAYISPEAAQGQKVGPQADVYSLAAVIYRCLSGRPVFEGDSGLELLLKHISDEPDPLCEAAGPGVLPEALCRVVMDNLAKSPAMRAQDATELGRRLAEVMSTAQVTDRQLHPEPTAQDSGDLSDVTSTVRINGEQTATRKQPGHGESGAANHAGRLEATERSPGVSMTRDQDEAGEIGSVASGGTVRMETAGEPENHTTGSRDELIEHGTRARGAPVWAIALVVVVCYIAGMLLAAWVSRQVGWRIGSSQMPEPETGACRWANAREVPRCYT